MPRLSQSERIRIVHLSAEGYSPTLISRKIGCSVKTVRFWVHRHKSSGSTRSIEGSGRPVLLSVDARKRAVQLLVAGVDGGARFVARKLFAEGLTPTLVLPGTVLRGAKAQSKEDGDDLICRRGRPPKLLSAVNKTRRVSFCTMNKSRPWARVMFTDRCKFAFRYPGCVVRSVRWLHRSKLHEDGASQQALRLQCVGRSHTLWHHQAALRHGYHGSERPFREQERPCSEEYHARRVRRRAHAHSSEGRSPNLFGARHELMGSAARR